MMMKITFLRTVIRYQRVFYAFITLSIYSIVFIQYILQRHQSQRNSNFDIDVISMWTDHVERFPIQPNDRYAMHEMGFRASIYSRLLEELDNEHIDTASRLRLALWDFLPGINNHYLTEKRDLGSQSILSPDLDIIQRMKDRLKRLKGTKDSTMGKEKGLVTVVEKDDIRSTVELVTTIRYSLKDDIDIEIYHFGENDLPELVREAFSMMPGVRIIDLSKLPFYKDEFIDIMGLQNLTHMRPMALQALALLVSRFDEIVYAAPGVLFFEKPGVLLEQAEYQKTGTYFFHGLNAPQLADSNRFLNYLRQQFDHAHPSTVLASSPFYNFGTDKYQDPRVLALDKSRPNVFSSLLLNVWMQSPKVRDMIWHAHFPQCLTETIWLSFELSKTPYYFEPAFAGAIGQYDGPLEDLPWQPTICPAHALHFLGRKTYASRGGKPLWMDGGLKLFPHHEKYLNIQAYSPRGHWEQTNLGNCLIGADARSPEDHGLAARIEEHKLIDETFIDIFSTIFDVYGLSIL